MLALLARFFPSVPSNDAHFVPMKRNPMPTFHAHAHAGEFSSTEERALADAFHRARMQAFDTPPGDRSIIISEHKEDELFIDDFHGMNRTQRAMIVTLTHGAQRGRRPMEPNRGATAGGASALHPLARADWRAPSAVSASVIRRTMLRSSEPGERTS
jgi:hypothetical protein